MKSRELFFITNLHSLSVVDCFKLFLLLLMSTIVINQELSSSSYSFVVAKSFPISEELARTTTTRSTSANSLQNQSQLQQQQQNRDINNRTLSSTTNNLQSTTTTNLNSPQPQPQPQPLEAATAAILSPSTSQIKPPIIVSKPEEIVVSPGSNVTLACSAQGSQPLTFVWFQDEKNLNKDKAPSTKLLEEKRYEIFEEIGASNTTTSILYLMNLRLTDTSLFLCWVENAAGYTFENYSLIVSESITSGTPLTSATNLYQSPPNTSGNFTLYPSYPVLIISLIVLLLITVVCIGLQIYNCRRDDDDEHDDDGDRNSVSKSTHSNDFKKTSIQQQQQHDKSSSPGGKFTPSTIESTYYDDDDQDDDNEDEDEELSQTSSCNKNNLRVLAVNDLDGFIDKMRSGIINMDYHSMSPVIQFNKNESLDQTDNTIAANNSIGTSTTIRPSAQSVPMTEQQHYQQQLFHHQQQQHYQARQSFTQPVQSYQMHLQQQQQQQQLPAAHYHHQPPQTYFHNHSLQLQQQQQQQQPQLQLQQQLQQFQARQSYQPSYAFEQLTSTKQRDELPNSDHHFNL